MPDAASPALSGHSSLRELWPCEPSIFWIARDPTFARCSRFPNLFWCTPRHGVLRAPTRKRVTCATLSAALALELEEIKVTAP